MRRFVLSPLNLFVNAILIVFSLTASAQQASLTRTLDRLAASATDFSTYIPKFSCEEHIHSERRAILTPFGPRIQPATMEAVSEIRVERLKNGSLQETRRWLFQDGRPVPPGTTVVPPSLLNEAFGLPLPAYLDQGHRACLRFSSSTGRLDFKGTALAGGGPCTDIGPQVTGFILFNPATGLISHIERTVPIAAGASGHFAPFASIDYTTITPTGSENRSYQSPDHIVARHQGNGYTLLFDAHYAACKFYMGVVTITDSQGRPITNESR